MKGMEYKDLTGASTETIEKYLTDPGWVMQQKMDGTRVLIDLETLQFSQRNGNPLKHTAATQWIPQILQELSDLGLSGRAYTILDCELMIHTGKLFIFDVIDWGLSNQTLAQRLDQLNSLPVEAGNLVHVVGTASTQHEKRLLMATCADREGVVVKRLDALYQPGVRTADVLKIKNIHTADLVVTKKTAEPLSAGLGIIMGDGHPATLANASLIGKEKDGPIEVGDVVEVSYLYWTGTSLVQPRIMRRRDDKAAVDCRMAQFTTYSRETV